MPPAAHRTTTGSGAAPGRRAVREADTRGSHCPGPLFEAIRLVRECAVGETVAVITADAASGSSIADWARRARHPLSIEDIDGGRRYLITRVH